MLFNKFLFSFSLFSTLKKYSPRLAFSCVRKKVIPELCENNTMMNRRKASFGQEKKTSQPREKISLKLTVSINKTLKGRSLKLLFKSILFYTRYIFVYFLKRFF